MSKIIIKEPYSKVTSLTLTAKGLTEIPSEVLLCKNLRKLNLSNNNIRTIPAEIKRLTKLKVLNLSNNNISQIQMGCCGLSNLQTLVLNGNKITSIPRQIAQLVNLKVLSLAGNRISYIPKELAHLERLEQLDISRNNLKRLVDSMQFARLKTLWAGNNPIETFDTNYYSNERFAKLYLYPSHSSAINKDYVDMAQKRGNIFNSKKNDNVSNIKVNNTPMRKSIFICYSHKDEDYKNRIIEHLKVLKYEQKGYSIAVWNDSNINSGQNWKKEIIDAIASASGAILIASTDFLGSEFIQMEELPRILTKLNKDQIKIFPIVVKPCRYAKSILEPYQSVNPIDNPLSGMADHNRECVYLDLVDSIEALLI